MTQIETVPINKLSPHPDNPRQGDIGAIAVSIQENGWYGTLVAQQGTGIVLAGNHRLQAAKQLGMKEVPVYWVDVDDIEARKILLADNRVNDLATYNDDSLAAILTELAETDDLLGTGYDGDDLDYLLNEETPKWDTSPIEWTDDSDPDIGLGDALVPVTLASRFIAPPFSILDTRQGYWRSRKREWLAMGIESEVGRDANLLEMSDTILLADNGITMPNGGSPSNASGNTPAFFGKKRELEALVGRELSTKETVEAFQTGSIKGANGELVKYDPGEMWQGAGTSIFDPVLCEIAYRWFCPPGGTIVDPFAGGSVRGIVAGHLGYSYYGVDLRPEQIEANEKQRNQILSPETPVKWVAGDSTEESSWEESQTADFVFTCPPYFDLEVYSDDPNDISNAEDIDDFFALLEAALTHADKRLQDNRFACVVMGEVRDKNGSLYDMIGKTVQAAENIGWKYYNDGILVTPVGSLALRAGRIFNGGRKMARAHQYVLVFCKGNSKKAHEACGPLTDLVSDLGETTE